MGYSTLKRGYTLLELVLILLITSFLVVGASYTYINSRNASEDKASQVALLSLKSIVYNNLENGAIPTDTSSITSMQGYTFTTENSMSSSEISYTRVDANSFISSIKTSNKCIIFRISFVEKSGWAVSNNDCKASNFINSAIDGSDESPRELS